ncbi:MAG: hypothetical protein J6127_00125 [Clostridiales bacterium]|nr:hypothetical protein [Clostridiales bacterium]
MEEHEGKIKKIGKMMDKLKGIVSDSIGKKNYRKALDAMTAASFILEEYNQYYVDEALESDLERISKELVKPGFSADETDKNTILFYDSFGFDVRALALIYMHALSNLGYKIIYITKIESKDAQPELHNAVKDGDVIWNYVSYDNRHTEVLDIASLFEKYKPARAFLYSTPDDAAAMAVFKAYEGIVERYKINLTDHAFWLGHDAFDYNLEFRNYGACVSVTYRGIPEEKEILMPFYPYHRPTEFRGLPFDAEGKKIIFSGGSIYKTLGDPANRFYVIVDRLLEGHDDTVFLYAGTGDDSEIVKLQKKYPERVYRIDERKDLFELMEHCTIYLNTFPMVGGLMMQFAADARKVPLTLIKEGSSNDVNKENLLHQETVEYKDIDSLIEEANRLLTDDEYRELRGAALKNDLISPLKFEQELKKALTEHKTSYSLNIQKIDTTEFRKQYIIRFGDKVFRQVIASGNKKTLMGDFPGLFALKAYNKIVKKEKLN